MALVLVIFAIFFIWLFPKVVRGIRKTFSGIRALFRGENYREVARKSS